MKKTFLVFAAAAVFAVACNNESSESGTDTNNTENTVNTDTGMGSDVTMGDNDTDSLSFDTTFMSEAASGGMMEVELGRYAQKNAAAAAVKQYGQMMVTDHTKANNELKAIAMQKGFTLPTTPAGKHQEHMSEMLQKKGAEFDKEYINMMVDDHKEDVEKFEEAAEKATDPALKAFAAKTLPVLKQHLEKVQIIKDGMKD